MATAVFRFYAELNDFLSSVRRQKDTTVACAENATVKQAVEALGVPHTEIEVILVNGESVDFSRRVEEGDRVAVYPVFEAVDVRPILRLRAEPLRIVRFLADAHLGRLARYLRMLGFDSLYENALRDRDLIRISTGEGRVLLTRDRELLMHRGLTHGIYVRGTRPREQLAYVVDRLDLRKDSRPFTRCMSCNGDLEEVEKETVVDRLPARVTECHQRFQKCSNCGRVYWPGTHWERMQGIVSNLMDRL